ncbi:hypothetical protein [Lichenibacterium dinghuense]|uniref:hypothetical protein n=1 Tax=Lichenibacterium dinghuense TaxID=2895977 RepID=UPI001F435FC3|nr:hypothetical protein [Lichenibacterium sp. 6Y81]
MSALQALAAVLRSALQDADVRHAVIGIDISYNEHLEQSLAPHWMLHARAHIPDPIDLVTVARLRTHFPRSRRIPRPCRITRLDGNPAGIAYGMKPDFERRQSYEQEKRTAANPRRCRNTRGRPLRGIDVVELLAYLDHIGLRQRLILHGTALVLRSDGTVVIRPVHRPRNVRPGSTP